MTQGSSAVERFVRKYIVWYKTLVLVVNRVMWSCLEKNKILTAAKIGDQV